MNVHACVRVHMPTHITHTHKTNTSVCKTLESEQVLFWFWGKKITPNVFCKQTGMGGTDTEDTCCEDAETKPAPSDTSSWGSKTHTGKKKELPKPKSQCGHYDLLAPRIEIQGPLCNLCSWHHRKTHWRKIRTGGTKVFPQPPPCSRAESEILRTVLHTSPQNMLPNYHEANLREYVLLSFSAASIKH